MPVNSLLNKSYLLAIASLIAIAGCSQKNSLPDSISIQGIITNPVAKNVSVYKINPFGELVTLAASALDSAGHFQMNIPADSPTEAYFLYGNSREELFLEPGFDLKISFDSRDIKSSIRIEGHGALENNFLREMQSFNTQLLNKETTTVQDFTEFINTYKTLTEEKVRAFKKKNREVSDLFILIQKNKAENIITRSYSLFNSSYKNGFENDPENLPEEFVKFWDRLDLQNSSLLISEDYRRILQTYIADKTTRIMAGAHSSGDYEKDLLKAGKLAVEQFLESDANPEIKEFVLASNISDRLEYNGFKRTKPDFESFINSYPDSKFADLLEERFATWLNIDIGRPAPDFKGTTPEGDTVNLSDLKDYVIYIDVWASWCKPCYEEFPHSVALRERFSPEEPVRFMYVSIDDEQDGWLKGLDRIPEVEGVHILVENAWRSEFAEKYVVKDIPRYMLIDRTGHIADIESDRPSSGQVLELKIRSLL